MDENPSNTEKAEAPAEPVVAETAAPEAGKAKAPKRNQRKNSLSGLSVRLLA